MLHNRYLLLLTALLLVSAIQASQSLYREENGVKSAVYLSPKFELGAGSVADKYYHNIDFPRGHIALKEFKADVVDEVGNAVPLHETYLHHWIIERYYALTGDNGELELKNIPVKNSGVCQNTLVQYFGLGAETRQTDAFVPDPYGIEVGNPADIPDGFEERWFLNVHAIDTRGVVDRFGCIECRCDLYNIAAEIFDQPYIGGQNCCRDQYQCRLIEGFKSITKNFYLRYRVKWVDWVDTVVPVKIYIFDVTDNGERTVTCNDKLGGLSALCSCKVEYDVKSCGVYGGSSNECLDSKRAKIVMPKGGHVIYAVAHQHRGGIGSALYGGGEGKEAGDEAGYIVGMTTCYPEAGSVKISNGETLSLESNYDSSETHTGVMGHFYLLVADQTSNNILSTAQIDEYLVFPRYYWVALFLAGVVIAFLLATSYCRRNEREEYQSLVV